MAVQGRSGDAREDPGSAKTKSGTSGRISPATASSCLDVSVCSACTDVRDKHGTAPRSRPAAPQPSGEGRGGLVETAGH